MLDFGILSNSARWIYSVITFHCLTLFTSIGQPYHLPLSHLILEIAIPLLQRQTPNARLTVHHRRNDGHRHILTRLPDHHAIRQFREITEPMDQDRDAVVRGGVRQIVLGVDVYQDVHSDELPGAGHVIGDLVGGVVDVIVFSVAGRKALIFSYRQSK